MIEPVMKNDNTTLMGQEQKSSSKTDKYEYLTGEEVLSLQGNRINKRLT